MTKLFISHSSKDDEFVRELRTLLADQGQDVWIDSRELRGGDPLWPEIQKAIEEASAYAFVVSPAAFQSDWVSEELAHALKIQKERGKAKYTVIPLALDGTKLGVFKTLIGEEPVYIDVSSAAGGVEASMNAILVALGKRLPADVAVAAQPKAEPLEELVLELTDLKFDEKDGVRRASARARLVYEPATQGQPDVKSVKGWRLIAPIGPIEAEELRWYLEKYAIWPSQYFRDRARKVEENLVKWGQLLYETAMPVLHTANVIIAWAKIGSQAGRRFSVYVDTSPEAGSSEVDERIAREAATLLLALPWELLHDGGGYLFQGAKPVRVRRRLPNTKDLDVPVIATPIRILLVTARPEDDSCGYIDHRASALPLVEAMESLPGLVKIHVLSPPTLPGLRAELDRARIEKKPYHVVHFDGHGVFNREVGLGGLCFENPEDIEKLEHRRHVTVFTSELGPLLRDHRIPLVFLEACQTAQAEQASESVASELLKVGVASVVAMSHSVLVNTARRFVQAFYEALANGKRVGDAMLAGQRQLKDDTFRGSIFGAGELRLEDWFVPVLYQEKDDPQLFKTQQDKQTQEDFRAGLAKRLGNVPPPPETGFIGRSRELLALQRLLREKRYAVVCGQGGEGKTALAAEFARWMVRSQQIRRAAFVSVETNGNLVSVVDALGKQLVHQDFSAAGDLDTGIQQVERALREQPALLVVDNMESVLLPPFMEKETPEALSQEAAEELKAILALCERLLRVGDTRVVFTSRESLPMPFGADQQCRVLFQLDREDAVKLVERVLNVAGGDGGSSSNAEREKIERLVESVHCHARTLALLAPALRSDGVEVTHQSLVELMTEMEVRFPGNREKSVFASVELSLRRMSDANRDKARVLGVFHGGVQLQVLATMMQWEKAEVISLGTELVETGLATPSHYSYLRLNPALCPYLRGQLTATELEDLTTRWVQAMLTYTRSLQFEQHQNADIAATLTVLELPNLFALLDLVQNQGDSVNTIGLVTALSGLLLSAGKPRLLERIGQVRDTAAAALGEGWNHAGFQAAWTRVEQQLVSRQLREALDGAQQLLEHSRAMGANAYDNADYDIAMAAFTLGRVLRFIGASDSALPLLEEAQRGFALIERRIPGHGAEEMVSNCIVEQGECLRGLGRLDEAASAFEESLRLDKEAGRERTAGYAYTIGELGAVRLLQGRSDEALKALNEARERLTELDQPSSVALVWHRTGIVYQQNQQHDESEDAYRQSLAISVQLGDPEGQARSLGQLGSLYSELGRTEEAVVFYRQAADKYLEVGNKFREGRTRNNLSIALHQLGRLDDARQEVQEAIECGTPFGHTFEPWAPWINLAGIEVDANNPEAALEAKRKGIDCFLAYRRDGGENNDGEGRLSLAVTKALLAGDTQSPSSFLHRLANDRDVPSHLITYIRALQAIVAGSRDRGLAGAPDLDYAMAAEILLLIETLENVTNSP